MKKRFLALLLCCAMVFGMMPGSLAQAFAAESDAPAICYNGSAADSVDLPQNEKILLTVSGSAADYQWQIESFGGQWANIAGSTGSALRLSYAMVANLLDGGEVSLRCRVTGEDGVAYTDPVTVTVTAPAASAPARVPSLGEILGDTFAEGSQAADDQLPAADPAVDPAANPVEGDDSSSGDESEITEPWTIIINYIFENGTEAAAPWTASVARGIDYSTTVTSPTVVGYEPDPAAVDIRVTPGETPQTTYTVTYHPAEVTFTVNHWLQNVNDNGYTLDTGATVEAKGFTGNPVGKNLAAPYDGFYSLLYDDTTAIAADGSTVVDVYYDRLYYLISFDLDGGYGVEPIYARYGADIEVDDPQRAGYTFTGWDREIPATVPADNQTFKALWTPADTAKVTIVFWGQDADDTDGSKYSYLDSSEVYVKPGKELTYSETRTLICALDEHTHTDRCYTCGQSSHTHSTSCYTGVGSSRSPLGAPSNPQNGQIYIYEFFGTHRYIYINGTWYRYSGSLSDGDIATPTCGKTEGVHTHTDACLGCGQVEHTHNSDCYLGNAGLDKNLWNFKSSDTVTVAADGTTILNVYYDRYEFTLTFRDGRNTVKTIEAKWGADIHNNFPIKDGNNTIWWDVPDGCESFKANTMLGSIDTMPGENIVFKKSSAQSGAVLYYYIETLNGETGTYTHDGKNFKLYKQITLEKECQLTYSEEFHNITGFTQWWSDPKFDKMEQGGVAYAGGNKWIGYYINEKNYLCYTRNSYTLRFFNYNAELKDKKTTVPYEDLIKNHTFTPPYPSGLEEGAYTFEGWYTDQFFHNKVTDATTMPAGDTIIFARWVPKTHTVRTFLTADSTNPRNTWEKVPHGSVIDAPEAPEREGGYKFVGWFYLDNGQEKAFDFSMPINRDLDLYAKWSSNVLVQYTIHYKLEDGTTIAPDTTGSGLAGSSKTFDAKAGAQLNAGYQEGYFPTTSSHSMVLDMDETKNEFTFVYVAKEKVKYTVRYLDKATGNPVVVDGQPISDKNAETPNAVITEEYTRIPGYRPDAYQKSLILSADEEENVLIFWYTKDDVHAPVHIIHWTQNITDDGYTQHLSYTDLDAIIGSTRKEDPLSIPGFAYNGENSISTGIVTAEGLELNLYYDRILYPYSFRFLEQGTNKELKPPIGDFARYQARVTQTAPEIPGYTLVSAESQTIQIAIEDPANPANKNVRIFYYTEQTVDIEYKVVGPTGCGTLDNYKESRKVITGTAAGSAATANNGFRFVGWFTDEACTVPANAAWISDTKLTPKKTQNYGTDTEPVMGYAPAAYYAKFEYDVADLTITKQGWEDIDEGQSFIFDVTGPGGYSKRVVVNGNGSVIIKGLKIGTYTVTEVTNWSWRYTADSRSQSIELKPAVTNAVTFVNTRSNHKWLSGDAYSKNIFGN